MSNPDGQKDMGKYLNRCPSLSSEFSKIAGTKVEIFLDRAIQMYLLRYKGRDCMWLNKNLVGERSKVRKHFTRLRNGEAPRDKYKEVWDKDEERKRDIERRWKDGVEYRSQEDAKMIFHYLFDGGPRSVVVDGGKK